MSGSSATMPLIFRPANSQPIGRPSSRYPMLRGKSAATCHPGAVGSWWISRAIQMPDPSVTSPPYPAGEPQRHFRVQVEGLRLRLPAGRYWLNVAPVVGGQVFLCATSGAHAVTLEPGSFGRALFHSSGGAAYVPAESAALAGQMGTATHFSQGVLIEKR